MSKINSNDMKKLGEMIEEHSRDVFQEKLEQIKKIELVKENYELYKALKEYKDLEEQGLLLRLPCKVGDRFWELNTVNDIPHIYPRLAHSLQHCVYVLERLGKTVFLTREEAEKALEKMKGEDDD